jgi:outer membrane lipase/esterase
MTASMNSALDYRLSTEIGVTTFDLFGLVSSIAADPGAYGLTNATNACGAVVNACNPATAMFWDGIHPTAAGHQILANAMVASVVPEPGMVWLMMAGLVGIGAALRRRTA